MSKVSIVYWTQGGNTQAMAEAIGEGVTAAGGEADVVFVSDANIADLKAEGAFALGCPAMGAEVLEEMEMEPFVQDVERFANGKKIALFGSYGWAVGVPPHRKEHLPVRLLRLGRRSVDARLGRPHDRCRSNTGWR